MAPPAFDIHEDMPWDEEFTGLSPVTKLRPSDMSMATPSCGETPTVDECRNEQSTESDEDRRRKEEDESLALARQLMAEEAVSSYHHHFQVMREAGNQLSQEDLEAFQAAMHEEEHEQVEGMEDEEGNLSYETMLQLGDRIGDVKAERWAMIAKNEIKKLPSFRFDASKSSAKELDDSERKCLVCQCEYEEDDELRRLPCSHCFHTECVDQWLAEKDACPYCRQAIRKESGEV